MKSKMSTVLIACIFILGISECKSQQTEKSALIEQDKSEILEVHSLPLPDGVVTLNLMKLFEMNGRYYLIAYFYPRHDLYIYDLSKNELVNQLKLGNIHSLNGLEFFSRDSIMLYGSSGDLKSDSIIQCVNLEGKIKQVYSLFFPNVISSKIAADPLLANNEELYPRAQFVFDHKIFLTFDYWYYGFKGYQKKYPLVGYYDLLKDTLVVNRNIWYPELDSSRYFAQSFYYQHSISLKENGNIDISFSYTPVIYEWDYKHNKIKEHKVDSKYMTAIPFGERKQKDDPEFNNFNPIHGLYLPGVSSVMKDKSKIYYREMMLSTAKYGDGKVIRVFFDSKYHYLGESLVDKNCYLNYYKSVYYMGEINNGRLDFKFVKPVFKPFDENKLKSKLDSIEKAEIEKNKQKRKEICGVVDRKGTSSFSYQRDDIVKFLQKNHQIQDTSFAVAIVNSKGCGPCNEYILNFVKINQGVFFNIKTRPFYLLYVNEGASYSDMTSYLTGFSLTDKDLVKMDNSVTYKDFSPSSLFNPRLVLVSQNKVILDNTYLPNELEKYVNDLLDYYDVIRK
jgi:hypothetical protein